MRKFLINLLIFGFGILLYVLMFYSHELIFVKIFVSEIGSFALCYSGFSIILSIKNKNE